MLHVNKSRPAPFIFLSISVSIPTAWPHFAVRFRSLIPRSPPSILGGGLVLIAPCCTRPSSIPFPSDTDFFSRPRSPRRPPRARDAVRQAEIRFLRGRAQGCRHRHRHRHRLVRFQGPQAVVPSPPAQPLIRRLQGVPVTGEAARRWRDAAAAGGAAGGGAPEGAGGEGAGREGARGPEAGRRGRRQGRRGEGAASGAGGGQVQGVGAQDAGVADIPDEAAGADQDLARGGQAGDRHAAAGEQEPRGRVRAARRRHGRGAEDERQGPHVRRRGRGDQGPARRAPGGDAGRGEEPQGVGRPIRRALRRHHGGQAGQGLARRGAGRAGGRRGRAARRVRRARPVQARGRRVRGGVGRQGARLPRLRARVRGGRQPGAPGEHQAGRVAARHPRRERAPAGHPQAGRRRGQRRQGLARARQGRERAPQRRRRRQRKRAAEPPPGVREHQGQRGRGAGQPQGAQQPPRRHDDDDDDDGVQHARVRQDRPRAGLRLRPAPAKWYWQQERNAAVGVAAVDGRQATHAEPPGILDRRAGQAEDGPLAVGADEEPEPQGPGVRVAEQHCRPQVRSRRSDGGLRRRVRSRRREPLR